MKTIAYRPVGVIRTPFKEPQGTPIQPTAARGVVGTVEVLPQYAEGLRDLDGFSHAVLLYHFHLAKGPSLTVKPFMDEQTHGVFATRAPARPNPIGLSVVRLLGVEGNVLHVQDVDIVDGTPLLDVKPYVPAFDAPDVERIGWLDENVRKLPESADDGRFVE